MEVSVLKIGEAIIVRTNDLTTMRGEVIDFDVAAVRVQMSSGVFVVPWPAISSIEIRANDD